MLGEVLKSIDWLKEKKPLLLKDNKTSIIISAGNAVYVAHQDIDHNLNVLYCEAAHKELVDNLINEIYASSEKLGVAQSETPVENE